MKAYGIAALAVLARAGCQQSPPAAAITDRVWHLDSTEATDLLAGARSPAGISLKLQSDGRLGGSGGCNNYFGSYKLDGGSIEVAQIGATRKACMGPIMDAEYRFLQRLSKAQRLDTEQGKLLIYSEGSASPMVFAETR